MKRSGKYFLSVLMTVLMACSLWGCGDAPQISEMEKLSENTASDELTEEDSEETEADEDSNLDQIAPDPADDNWYMKGSIYKNDSGHYVEVFFDDGGMLEFAVDGLSLYYSHVDKVQYENNWRIYDCEDGTMIVYYPGEPAHLEIYDGDEPRLYEEGGDKVK